jgi:hypothetical protein
LFFIADALRQLVNKAGGRGVDKFFKTLAKVASRPIFLLAKTENNWPKI